MELVPKGYRVWRENKPPISTWVWGIYRAGEKPQLVLTCKRGCCVYSDFGCMILPAYWHPATEAEGVAAQAEYDKPRVSIDPFDLYE